MTVDSNSSLQATETGSSSQRREINPQHEKHTTGDSARGYLASSKQHRDIGRHNQKQIVSPRRVRDNGRYPHSREGDAKHQSSVGSYSQTMNTHVAPRPQTGKGVPYSSTNIEHSTTGSGGWLEDEEFGYPCDDMYPPGYANERKDVRQTNNFIQRHGNDQPKDHPRRPFQHRYGNRISDYVDEENSSRGNAQVHKERLYARQLHANSTPNNRKNSSHSHGLSYGNHRFNHEPNDSEQFDGPRKPYNVNEENKSRGNAQIQEMHNAHSHNRVDQESLYAKQSHATSTQSNSNNSAHPHGLSCAKQRSSNKPNDSEQFEMDMYGAQVIASRSIDKQINPTKNLQESFYSDTSLTEDEDEEEDDDDYGSGSELDLAEEKAQQKLLPKVKELVDKLCGSTKPSLCGDIELSCLVCPTAQHFKGWKALLSHAQHFKKKRTIQHRGYYRALESVLKIKEEQGQGQEQEGPISVRASFIDPTVSESHLIVWPPIVVIETTNLKSNLSLNKAKSKEILINKKEVTTEGMEIRALLSEELQDLHPQQFIYSGNNKFVISFEASSVGYMEAKVMNDRLRERKRGREDGILCRDQRYSSLSRAHNERTALFFGYLAEPADLKIIDPNKTIIKNWSEESYQEKVQGANKRMKKENEDKQAKLKAMELEVVSLSEKEQNFKMRKQALCYQIETRQKEIEDQQNRTKEMQEWFAKEESILAKKFEEEMGIMDKASSAKEGELKKQLERDEKLRENETISRMRQIERRRLELQELKESYEKIEEQKALDKEAEAMAKRKNFMAEVRKAEADFNEQIRVVESSLQDQQQGEMIKLVEEIEHEKEAFYKEWLNEQETLKNKAEEVRKQKEQLQKGNDENEMTPECMVCWDNLTPENRALLDPCGHARLCIDCAKEVFKTRKECPLCRAEIKKRPILCPKSLLGAC